MRSVFHPRADEMKGRERSHHDVVVPEEFELFQIEGG